MDNIAIEDVEGKKGISIRGLSKPSIASNKKIKIFWYSDFLINTGFGNVAQEIVKRLQKTGKYEFIVLGINHNGNPYNYKTNEFFEFKDIPVFPAADETGLFGFQKFANILAEHEPDLVFVMQDTFNMARLKGVFKAARKQQKPFKYIFYYPVDGLLKKDWVDNAVAVADYPVAYNKFGIKATLAQRPTVPNLIDIPHGVDAEVFKPFAEEKFRQTFRTNFFKRPEGNKQIDENTFIITNVNRNQPRKDVTRTILAYAEFYKRYPEIDSMLYMHMHCKDGAGFDLETFTKLNIPKEVWGRISYPNEDIFKRFGYPKNVLAKIYAASDIVTSTTLGEGFGLSTVEAMACGTPVVMPKHTANFELIGENEERGYLVDCGKETIVMKYDNEQLRPVTDIDSMVNQWKRVYDNYEEAEQKSVEAYKWVQGHTWDDIAKQWDELFQRAYSDLLKA